MHFLLERFLPDFVQHLMYTYGLIYSVVFSTESINLWNSMNRLSLHSFIALTAACFFLLGELLNAQPQRAYERGLEELNAGNRTQALDTWYDAYSRIETGAAIDSRIGFEYIRVVTENRMKDFYEEATEMYYRSLNDGGGSVSRVAIRQEIERLRPITGDGIYRQWMAWWEEQNPGLGSDMRGYWVQMDPTPAKLANERLIEHWLRIATARERYTKNTSTIYGTDERAHIYVRYGEPDRAKSGILTLQSLNIKSWLENQIGEQTSSAPDENPARDMTQEETDLNRMNRLEEAIYHFHRYPEYEVWFYENIAVNIDEPVIFLFGTDVRNERFSLQTSLEDFIPERAFNPERDRGDTSVEFTRAGITPALMLQLIYYEQLVNVDPFFENRLTELQDRVLEQGIEAFQGMDLTFRSESREIVNRRTGSAPSERSTFAELIPQIPLQVHQYRFLNEQLEPQIRTYIESDAHEAFMIDYHRNPDVHPDEEIENGENVVSSNGYYELSHNLQLYDDDWNVIFSDQHNPELIINRSTDNGSRSVSHFVKPHGERSFQSVSAELMNYNPDTRAVYDTPFPDALRGWNKVQLRQPTPLHTNPDSLELADLVLGYEDEENHTDPFSFVLANDQLIPFGKTLVLHFEVYHLERMPIGFTQFELTYRILPVDEDGNVLTDQTEFVLTLNFTNEDQRVVEDLEIETADLRPGLYDLRVRVEDTVTSQSKERVVRFEVAE